jgi:hypothetical protein
MRYYTTLKHGKKKTTTNSKLFVEFIQDYDPAVRLTWLWLGICTGHRSEGKQTSSIYAKCSFMSIDSWTLSGFRLDFFLGYAISACLPLVEFLQVIFTEVDEHLIFLEFLAVEFAH